MNRTRTLTQGAMLLAIYGALVLIDRITAFWFTELVVLIAPIIIIIYNAMQSFKDSIFLSIGIIIISFLLGNFNLTYLIYVPIGIVTGLLYSLGVNKGFDKRLLLFIAVASYVVGEIITVYVVYPLIGFPISQMLEQYKEALSEAGTMSGTDYFEYFETAGLSLDKIFPIIYLLSTMITGAMEGVLIHILSIFLLKRFKIKDLGSISLWEIKPNKVVAYVSFLATFALYFRNAVDNEIFFSACIGVGVIGAVILLYYAYLFVVLYGHIVWHKNIGGLLVIVCIFVPTLIIGLVCIGFLYGAGPLRTYLENKVNEIKNTNINKNE